MDKLGSFGRRWILGVRRVTISYQIETELAGSRRNAIERDQDRGFLVIDFFPEFHL